MPDGLRPHEQVAAQFMAHKGYGDIQPHSVEKLDNETCWYFYYQFPEGDLELEVYWDGHEWDVLVSTFSPQG